MIFNEDNYYLMCYSFHHDGTVNYRVDRMSAVEIIDEDISEKAIERGGIDGYTEQAFKMYGGQCEKVSLEFNDKLIGVVYDKFGEDTKMVRTGEYTIVAAVEVQISPTFWDWLFQFGDQMRILSPRNIAQEYRRQAQIVVVEQEE